MIKYRATCTLRDDSREVTITAIDRLANREDVYTAVFPLNVSPRNAVDMLAEHHGIDVAWRPMLTPS